jgi:hypothetical protein
VIIHQRVQAEQIVVDSKVSRIGNVVIDNVRVTNITDIVRRRKTSELSAAASHDLLLLTNVHSVALMVFLMSLLASGDDICVQWFPSEPVIEEDVFPGL